MNILILNAVDMVRTQVLKRSSVIRFINNLQCYNHNNEMNLIQIKQLKERNVSMILRVCTRQSSNIAENTLPRT